ncbi:MAG TPA: pyrimidine 5'-nucleotidase [Anaerolineaceae bacterium]|jgi:pyrimidine 5'-nucleotidase|nr:pyrimidine 5'-nucleotidase [Anaerolineaceae bacterium]NMC17319.1 pyrimidine 5'-nucleotidase [Chloroflexota bacterium]HNS06730.1 pyrimidine 5'-nucleotidase [Anaerolineaceae bacterium]
MSFAVMLFDLDDTLYPSTSGVWDAIGDRMDSYIIKTLGVAANEVKQIRNGLFHEYGTTLRGLKTLYHIDERDFLDYVHDIPLAQFLGKDEALIETISAYDSRKVIFTNANQGHAERVLEVLGLADFFPEIVDVLQISPYCKPLPQAYQKALEIIQIEDPEHCVFIDDSPRNLKTAREMGFYTIQVGTENRCEFADAAILSLLDLPDVIPSSHKTMER